MSPFSRHRVSSTASLSSAPTTGSNMVGGPGHLVARPRLKVKSTECEPEVLNAEDPLSTSSTPRAPPGKPKGIVHSQGGYLTSVTTTHSYVFDHQTRR